MERGVRSQPPLALLLTSLPSLPESRYIGSPDSQVLLAQATQAPHCPGSSYSPISPGSTSSPLSQALQSPSPGVEGSSDFLPSPKSTGLPLFTGYPLLYRPGSPHYSRVCLLSSPPSLPRLTTLPLLPRLPSVPRFSSLSKLPLFRLPTLPSFPNLLRLFWLYSLQRLPSLSRLIRFPRLPMLSR